MRTKWVEEKGPILPLVCCNFSASTANVRVDVEGLPQSINAVRSWLGSNIQQNANIGLKHRPKGVEEPPMAVDFLLVLLLHAEDNLGGYDTLVRVFEMEVVVDGE